MIAYIDSSVLLRLILGHPDRLREWKEVRTGGASALVEVECLRTLDRMRVEARLAPEVIAERRTAVYEVLESVEIIEISNPVLRRASMPLPTSLGTLDAIHLSSALLWGEVRNEQPVMLTHDRALASAARASGLRVLGV
jgi:predicted nucleic acid-binding protein